MSITAEQLATKAGLSVSTISYALNDHPRIAFKTRQRIKALAAELGYRPNAAARSLRKQVQQNVGVVIASPREGHASVVLADYAAFLVSLTEQLQAMNRGVLLGMTSQMITPDKSSTQLPYIADQLHTDRIVVLGHMWPKLDEAIKLLSLRAIVVDGPSCGLPSVQRNEEHAAEQLVDHFVEHGHRRIAFMNHGGGKVISGYRDVLWPKGYLHAITRHQLVPVPGWNLYEEIEEAIHRLMTLDQPPTALIVYDDDVALWAIQSLADRGLSVPKDISVAAMLDIGIGGHGPRPITRMARPNDEMARQVVQLLTDDAHVSNGDGDEPSPVIKLPGQLIPGQSVSPAVRFQP